MGDFLGAPFKAARGRCGELFDARRGVVAFAPRRIWRGAGFARVAIMDAPIRPCFHPRREHRHIGKVGGGDIGEGAEIVGFSDP